MTSILTFLQAVPFDATAAALLVAGVLAPFLTQVTKNVFGVDSLKAYLIHIAASAALALGAIYAFGGFAGLTDFAAKAGLVATIGTTLFKFWKAQTGLNVEPGKPPEPPLPPLQ